MKACAFQPPPRTSAERYDRFELKTAAHGPRGVRLPRNVRLPHKNRTITPRTLASRIAVQPSPPPGLSSFGSEFSPITPGGPERGTMIDVMWDRAQREMANSTANRARRRHKSRPATSNHGSNHPMVRAFSWSEPAVVHRPERYSVVVPQPMPMEHVAYESGRTARARDQMENVYGDHSRRSRGSWSHSCSQAELGPGVQLEYVDNGFVKVDNESHRETTVEKMCQTDLLSRQIDTLHKLIKSKRDQEGKMVLKALNLITLNTLYSYVVYWRTVVTMKGEMDVPGVVDTVNKVQTRMQHFGKGLTLWLKVYSEYAEEASSAGIRWAFSRWESVCSQMQLRREIREDEGIVESVAEWTSEQMDVLMLMQEVVLPLQGARTYNYLLELASGIGRWLIRCDDATVVLVSSSKGEVFRTSGEKIPLNSSLLKHVVNTKKPLLCNAVNTNNMFNPLIDRMCKTVHSILLVPVASPDSGAPSTQLYTTIRLLFAAGELMAVMIMSKSHEGDFSSGDQLLVELLVSHLAVLSSQAIEREDCSELQEQLHAVLQSVLLSPLTDRRSEVFGRILHNVQHICRAPSCGVYQVKDEKLQLVAGVDVNGAEKMPKIAVRSTQQHSAWKKKQLQCSGDAQAHSDLAFGDRVAIGLLSVPMLLFESAPAARIARETHLYRIKHPGCSIEQMCQLVMEQAKKCSSNGEFIFDDFELDQNDLFLSEENQCWPALLMAKCEQVQTIDHDGHGLVSLQQLIKASKELIDEVAGVSQKSPTVLQAREGGSVGGVVSVAHVQGSRYSEVARAARRYKNIASIQIRIAQIFESRQMGHLKTRKGPPLPLSLTRTLSLTRGVSNLSSNCDFITSPTNATSREENTQRWNHRGSVAVSPSGRDSVTGDYNDSNNAKSGLQLEGTLFDRVYDHARESPEDVLVFPRVVNQSGFKNNPSSPSQASTESKSLMSSVSVAGMGFWVQANQAAMFASACTSMIASQLLTSDLCGVVRIFVEFVHAGHRCLLYLDNGETEWHTAPSTGIAGRVLNQMKCGRGGRIVRAEEMSVHYDVDVDIPRNETQLQKMVAVPMPIGDGNATGLQGLMQVQRTKDFSDADLLQLEIFAGVVAVPLLFRWGLDRSKRYTQIHDSFMSVRALPQTTLTSQTAVGLEAVRSILDADVVTMYHVDLFSGSLVHAFTTCHPQLQGKVKMNDFVLLREEKRPNPRGSFVNLKARGSFVNLKEQIDDEPLPSALLQAVHQKIVVTRDYSTTIHGCEDPNDLPLEPADYLAAHVAAIPIVCCDKNCIAVLLCSRRESTSVIVPPFPDQVFSMMKPLLKFVTNTLLKMSMADRRADTSSSVKQLTALAVAASRVESKIWASPSVSVTIHPTLQAVQDFGLSELEFVWRVKQALQAEAVVLWITKEGEPGLPRLYKSHSCFLDANPYEVPTERNAPSPGQDRHMPGSGQSVCSMGQGLIGISFSRTELIHVILQRDPFSPDQMATKVGDKELDELVDIPHGLRAKDMSCLCYPLLCEAVDDPNSYMPAGRPGRPTAKRADGTPLRCVGVLQVLNQRTCLGRMDSGNSNDLLFMQSFCRMLFQRILSGVDIEKRDDGYHNPKTQYV